MAYALVQATTSQGAPTPTLPAGATANNLIIVAVCNVTNNVGLTDVSYARATAAGVTAIFYKVAAGGETNPGAITGGSNANGFIAEFSGGATSSPVDQVAPVVTGAASPLSLTEAAADATSGSLVIGCQRWSLSKAGTQTSGFTFNNGATGARFDAGESDDAASVSTHDSAWWGVTTGNSTADTGSATSNSMNITTGTAVMASFKIFVATAPVLPLPHPAFIYLRKNR